MRALLLRPTRHRAAWAPHAPDNYFDRGTNLGYIYEPRITPAVYRQTQQTAGPAIHFTYTPPLEDQRHRDLQRGIREINASELIHIKNRISDLTVRTQQTTDPGTARSILGELKKEHLVPTEEFTVACLSVFFRANSPDTLRVWNELLEAGAPTTIPIVDLLLDVLLDTSVINVSAEEASKLSTGQSTDAQIESEYRLQQLKMYGAVMNELVCRKLEECIADAAAREDPDNAHHKLERRIIDVQGIGGILSAEDPVRTGLEVFSRARRRWKVGFEAYTLATALAPVPVAPAPGEMEAPRRTQSALLIMLEAIRKAAARRAPDGSDGTAAASSVVDAYFARLAAAMEDSASRLDEVHFWQRRAAISAGAGEPAPSIGHGGSDRSAFIAALSDSRVADSEARTTLSFCRPAPLYYANLIIGDLKHIASEFGVWPSPASLGHAMRAAALRNDLEGASSARAALVDYFCVGPAFTASGRDESVPAPIVDGRRYTVTAAVAEDALSALTYSGPSLYSRQTTGDATADADADAEARAVDSESAGVADALWGMACAAHLQGSGTLARFPSLARYSSVVEHVEPASATLLAVRLADVARKGGPAAVVQEFSDACSMGLPTDAAVFHEVLSAFAEVEALEVKAKAKALKSKDGKAGEVVQIPTLAMKMDDVLEQARLAGHHYVWAKFV